MTERGGLLIRNFGSVWWGKGRMQSEKELETVGHLNNNKYKYIIAVVATHLEFTEVQQCSQHARIRTLGCLKRNWRESNVNWVVLSGFEQYASISLCFTATESRKLSNFAVKLISCAHEELIFATYEKSKFFWWKPRYENVVIN